MGVIYMRTNVKEICIIGLLIALVAVSTMIIQIPVPATSGYIHAGDGIIFMIALLFKRKYGVIAGGVGSMLADILSGYAHWALFTLVIKSLMAFAVSTISNNQKSIASYRNIFAISCGVLVMIFGYFIGGAILKGSFLVSLASIPENFIQGLGGAIIAVVLGLAIQKGGIAQRLNF